MRPLRDLSARQRALAVAAAVYAVATGVYLLFAAPATLSQHTPYNHFALLAESWLDGRLDLGGPPPAYAGGNDFSSFDGKWYVPFPPFPALLLVPFVWLAGSAEALPDGLVFIAFAGLAPALLFLVLDALSASGRSERSLRENALLALAFAFGSVYFFSAVQGTVWYAAHVVAAALAALYVYAALGARRPLLAGVALAAGMATRTPLAFALPLFLAELVAVCSKGGLAAFREPRSALRELDRRRLLVSLGWFALPLTIVVVLTLAHNHARFGDPFEVGYRYLTVVWRARIEKWGLFDYHYLARNLGVVLTSLPWLGDARAPVRITGHGLALWVTTPLYLWLAFPKRTGTFYFAVLVTALCVALPTLFYQNTGWVQFGYRFSNDYAVFLFVLLALGARRFGVTFVSAAIFAVLVNAFGAATFNREAGARYYYLERTQRVLYEPD
jgi:hypothetical protein